MWVPQNSGKYTMERYVIYWRGTVEVRTDLVKSLKSKGFPIVILRGAEEVLSQVRRSLPAAIIVDASGGDMELAGRVVSLEDSFEMAEVPILLFGKRASVLGDRLKERYRICVLIDLPFQPQAMLEQMQRAMLRQDDGQTGGRKHRSSVSGVHARVHTLSNRDPARLVGTHGGTVLASANSLSDFDDKSLIPGTPHAEALREALAEITARGEQMGVHVRRVTFAASAATAALNKGEHSDGVVRAASLLFDLSASEEDPNLVTSNFASPSAIAEREAIAQMVEKSAETAITKLGDREVARVLEISASLLHGNKPLANGAEIEHAEIVLLAEATNRSCWRGDKWSAHGSYQMLRALRNGTFSEPNSEVSEAYARIVAEALGSAAVPTVAAFSPFSLSERGRRLLTVEQSIRQAEHLYESKRLREVPFKDIRPGMLLGRPLISFDGAVILEANVRLDRNLVLRIWEMQALRPLHGPVFVVREHTGA